MWLRLYEMRLYEMWFGTTRDMVWDFPFYELAVSMTSPRSILPVAPTRWLRQPVLFSGGLHDVTLGIIAGGPHEIV